MGSEISCRAVKRKAKAVLLTYLLHAVDGSPWGPTGSWLHATTSTAHRHKMTRVGRAPHLHVCLTL
ncbi:hypothetical protein PF005_g2910 [Phytophthora fragariae]|uniref:Uncharacterized protein n=1 Tax=Phytophthora fragariae TaxID=53985 RepID=A0A6A3ZAC4_9STRA|nr:hypothetical protein PF003_g13794 [Phytophthora fragariae]KAE8947315.1 hypothetical protein PF009_g3067 [Phytophthora fragariae]KAE9016180.1 hypothetical protein PF011_g7271 [Phytophthora fragariae]KAE9113242.1 hypothetical protein PF010_g10157 [Phytophthora fragariae]KAE9139696.1 hypothetical protein PF007_g912 [Phytophthora fragariae]